MLIDLGESNLKDQCEIPRESPDEFQDNSCGMTVSVSGSCTKCQVIPQLRPTGRMR